MARNFSGIRRYRNQILAIIALLVIAARLINQSTKESPTDAPLGEGTYRVQRVVDGDTLKLEDGTRVRLIGVNTPEMTTDTGTPEPWATEATEFTEAFVANKDIRLQFDRERLDQFGRTLAYVWVGEEMLNDALVEAGLARVPKHYRYASSARRRFEQLQDEARAAKRGIWSGGRD